MQVLKLYPNVIPVKGYNRSLLIDLQRATSHLVPNDLIDCLEKNVVSDVKEYEDFILDNELGIFIDAETGANLTLLPTAYYPASTINNAILELDEGSSWSIPAVLNQLDELGTQFLEVRFLDFPSLQKNLKVLQECSNDTTIESIQLMVPFSKDLKSFLDETLNERFFRLNTIVVYNAQSGFELGVDFYNLVFTAQSSVSQEHCGTISMEHFRLDTQSYTRSKNYNSCLAHKISINKNGFIGNCPSMNSTFGHVDSTPFSAAIAGSEFQSLWKLTKDKVLVCSVCEFREICADCRAFTVDDHENGKPSKCGYNPFINLWEGEENYLPEEQCGVVYDTGKLVINESLLASINRKIWD